MLCESSFEMTVGSNNVIAMMAAFYLTPINTSLELFSNDYRK